MLYSKALASEPTRGANTGVYGWEFTVPSDLTVVGLSGKAQSNYGADIIYQEEAQ